MLASCGSDIKYLEWPGCNVRNTYKNAGSISSTYFRCVSWCNSGRKIATIPHGNFPIVIDPNELEDYKGLNYQEIQVPRVNTLAFSKRKPHFITLGCETGHIFQYDTRDQSIHIISSLPSPVNIVKYGIADEALAASCTGGQIYIFNANEKLTSTYFVPNSWSVTAMSLHPSEKNVLCGASKEGIVAVWDFTTGHLKYQTRDHQSEVTGLAFSPCDWLFASTSADYTLNMYDLRMKERIFYKMFNQKLSAVAFPSHGNHFAVGTHHGKVMTFDKRKLSTPKMSVQVHEGPVRQFAFQNENTVEEQVIKACQSEISFKTDQSIPIFQAESRVVGSGDAVVVFGTTSMPKTSKIASDDGSFTSSDAYSQQALLGAQEEICKCTEETLKSLVREMNDKFLRLWMSINKDLAKIENRSEMRWKNFHATIFDLGNNEDVSSVDGVVVSVGSQTTAAHAKEAAKGESSGDDAKSKKRTFKMFS